MLGDDDVVIRVSVPVLFVQSLDVAPLGAAMFLAGRRFCRELSNNRMAIQYRTKAPAMNLSVYGVQWSCKGRSKTAVSRSIKENKSETFS